VTRFAGTSLLVLAVVLAGAAGGRASERRPGAISGYGISATLPPGWHGHFGRGLFEASTTPLPRSGVSPSASLSGALGGEDIGLLLFEDVPTAGVPFNPHAYGRAPLRPFTLRDFASGPSGSDRGHRFVRRGIRVSGRYFALFAEAGSAKPSAPGVAGLNLLVRSLQVRAGDFYPGTVAPARLPARPGWYLRDSADVPLGPETAATTIAATIPYRDTVDAFPPHETLARLPDSGVIIYVQLVADSRNPPLGPGPDDPRGVRVQVPRAGCGSFEGIPGVETCPLHVLVDRRYTIQGWVIYGRSDPTREQRTRAQAELDRLELPVWPLWPSA
jgi:hypothetical protein